MKIERINVLNPIVTPIDTLVFVPIKNSKKKKSMAQSLRDGNRKYCFISQH
jgi:hypothetical protein